MDPSRLPAPATTIELACLLRRILDDLDVAGATRRLHELGDAANFAETLRQALAVTVAPRGPSAAARLVEAIGPLEQGWAVLVHGWHRDAARRCDGLRLVLHGIAAIGSLPPHAEWAPLLVSIAPLPDPQRVPLLDALLAALVATGQLAAHQALLRRIVESASPQWCTQALATLAIAAPALILPGDLVRAIGQLTAAAWQEYSLEQLIAALASVPPDTAAIDALLAAVTDDEAPPHWLPRVLDSPLAAPIGARLRAASRRAA